MSCTAAPVRGNHPHALGHGGKRLFARLVKQPFGTKLPFQLLKLQGKTACTVGNQLIRINLILSACGINGDPTAHDDPHSVGRSERNG